MSYQLRIFRNIQGVRVPYTLTLDAHRNVVKEVVDSAELERQIRHADSFALGPPSPPPALPDLSGLTPPPHPHAGNTDGVFLTKFVEWSALTDPPLPNPFPGTEGLRAEFFAAMRAEIAAAETEGRACSDCDLGKVAAQYRERLKAQTT